MKIGIEVNGVLRNTIGKFEQLYEKFLIEEQDDQQTFELEFSGSSENLSGMTKNEKEKFLYKKNSEVTSLNLMEHFSFKDENELYSFMYEDFAMQLFGHAGSTETFTFNDLNDVYVKYRDKNDLTIISDEIGKSKPATLFFLSKFGCLLEKIKFYSNSTINSMWDEVDILLTANPDLIKNKPKDKVIIKFVTDYNKNIKCENEIESLNQLDKTLQKLKL